MTTKIAEATPIHEPVLLDEVILALGVRPGGRYVDCTVDGGGHAEAILNVASPGGSLLGIDEDAEALGQARNRLARFGRSVALVNGNFRDIEAFCRERDFAPVNGILLDLGLSSLQLANASRGFSFRLEGPLDMRFGPGQDVTASYWVNEADEEDLADVLWRYGEERNSRRVARAIVQGRPLETTTQLAKAVEQAVGRRPGGQIHPATKTFQALRIAVNRELANLADALPRALGLLGFGSRIVVISYHSLEDRIVKQFFSQEAKGCICPPRQPVCTCGRKPTLKLITRGAVTPSPEEISRNPRSRSAKLRAAESFKEGTDGIAG
jgi:16S rRNA (cytosine1402-N4)-methyltransferase